MNYEITTYKIVRQGEGQTLLSALLPDHLAETYRDQDGNFVTVPHSLAFDTAQNARAWRDRVKDRIEPELQLWIARAEAVAGHLNLPTFSYAQAVRFSHETKRFETDTNCHAHHISEVSPDLVSKEDWRKITAACREDIQPGGPHWKNYGICHFGYSIDQSDGGKHPVDDEHPESVSFFVDNRFFVQGRARTPKGTLLCQDLQLVAQLV